MPGVHPRWPGQVFPGHPHGNDMREAVVHGFQVDPDALAGYARTARHVADDLAALTKRELHGVHDLAADSFGKIGAVTGFSAALDQFGKALSHQVDAVGKHAGTLSHAVSRTAGDYQDEEQGAAAELIALLRDV
jgi:hypothetical protein